MNSAKPDVPGGDRALAATHVIVLPGGGYSVYAAHEGEPVASWLRGLGVSAGVFFYPLNVRHPAPLEALRAEVERVREGGAERVGVMGFSAGGHLAGLAALARGARAVQRVDFAVLGYSITSMETDTYRPARLILLGEHATAELRRATSLDALVTPKSPPFFMWHTAEDIYVPPEHTYRLPRLWPRTGYPTPFTCSHTGRTVWAWLEEPGPCSCGRTWLRLGWRSRAAGRSRHVVFES